VFLRADTSASTGVFASVPEPGSRLGQTDVLRVLCFGVFLNAFVGFLSLAHVTHLFITLYVSWNVSYFRVLILIVVLVGFIHTCDLFGHRLLHSFSLALRK